VASTWPIRLLHAQKEQHAVTGLLWAEGVVRVAELHRRMSEQYDDSILPQQIVYECVEMLQNG
jgi:hypothetical protein